jgi:hypothetical protein
MKGKKLIRGAFKIVKGIGKGILDTVLPNVANTIKMKEPDLPNEKPKFQIDFARLITAVTIWILLILVFFGKIKSSDVLDLISKLLLIK